MRSSDEVCRSVRPTAGSVRGEPSARTGTPFAPRVARLAEPVFLELSPVVASGA